MLERCKSLFLNFTLRKQWIIWCTNCDHKQSGKLSSKLTVPPAAFQTSAWRAPSNHPPHLRCAWSSQCWRHTPSPLGCSDACTNVVSGVEKMKHFDTHHQFVSAHVTCISYSRNPQTHLCQLVEALHVSFLPFHVFLTCKTSITIHDEGHMFRHGSCLKDNSQKSPKKCRRKSINAIYGNP